MPLSPPKALAPKNNLKQDPLTASLEHEVLAEKAATYGRLVQQLEKALAQLREFEAVSLPLTASSPETSSGSPPPGGRSPIKPGTGSNGRASMASRPAGGLEASGESVDKEHEALLDAAGRALWYVMVQRDLCGFRRHDLFYKELNVPASVRLRMGIARSR